MSAPLRVYRSLVSDSTRWDGFEFRSDDIVISTPPKCGTTWMQMICGLLIFQSSRLPQPLSEISPWLDMLTLPRDEVFARLASQQHRRFIKSHTPLDGLPMDPRVTYICVGRDPRDVGVSMDNHRANFRPETFLTRRTQVTGSADVTEHLMRDPPPSAPTLEGRFWHWVDQPTPPEESTSSLATTLRHFEQALAARERDNVIVLHYTDLKADLEGEMRGLARRLGIGVPEARWPTLVEAASFDAMRSRADELVPNVKEGLFRESERFFHGGSGAWSAFFDEAGEQRYRQRVAALTSPLVAAWAHEGRRAL